MDKCNLLNRSSVPDCSNPTGPGYNKQSNRASTSHHGFKAFFLSWWNVQFEDGQVRLQIIGVLLSLGLHVALQDSQVLWVVPANRLTDVTTPQSGASLVNT